MEEVGTYHGRSCSPTPKTSTSKFPKQLFYRDEEARVVLSWLLDAVCKIEYTIGYIHTSVHMPSAFFCLFIVFWPRRKAIRSDIPCRMGLGLSQVGCSSRGPCSLQQFSWQEDQAELSWTPLPVLPELLENKWSVGNVSVWTGWQAQTWKASRRVLLEAFECYVWGSKLHFQSTHQRLGFALPLYNRSALQFHTNDANRFGDQLNQQKTECLRGWLKAGRTPGPRRMLCCSRTSCAPPRDHHFIPRASLTLVLHHLPSGCWSPGSPGQRSKTRLP